MKRIVLLIAVLLFLGIPTSCQQVKSGTLTYLVKEPAIINNHTPLLLLLHGYGSNEADLFGLTGQLPKEALVIAARGPYEIGNNAFSWFGMDFSNGQIKPNISEEEKTIQVVAGFIDEMIKKYHINPANVYLLGFSQGSILSYSIGLTRPGKIKGFVALSGRILPEIKPDIAGYEKLKPLSIFIAHGTDDNVLPVADGRDANSLLTDLGLKPVYHEYKMKHQIIPQELSDVDAWLEQKFSSN